MKSIKLMCLFTVIIITIVIYNQETQTNIDPKHTAMVNEHYIKFIDPKHTTIINKLDKMFGIDKFGKGKWQVFATVEGNKIKIKEIPTSMIGHEYYPKILNSLKIGVEEKNYFNASEVAAAKQILTYHETYSSMKKKEEEDKSYKLALQQQLDADKKASTSSHIDKADEALKPENISKDIISGITSSISNLDTKFIPTKIEHDYQKVIGDPNIQDISNSDLIRQSELKKQNQNKQPTARVFNEIVDMTFTGGKDAAPKEAKHEWPWTWPYGPLI